MATRELIRVFESEPELLAGVSDEHAARLRAGCAAPVAEVPRGEWLPRYDGDLAEHLGLLVTDGFVTRVTTIRGRNRCELVGPGDLIRPWDPDETGGSIAFDTTWRTLTAARLATLDAGFARAIAPWPAITANLLARSARRLRGLAVQATVAHIRHADARVLLTLWHFADRWGRVTPDGVALRIPLTHRLLAELTCMRRPTASLAVARLTEAGRVSRLPAGGWMLHGAPPANADDPPLALVAA